MAQVSLGSRRRDRGRARSRRSRFATSGAERIEARNDTDDGNGSHDDPGYAWAHGGGLRLPYPRYKCLAGTLEPAPA